MMIAAVLITTACGDPSESSVGTNTLPSESMPTFVDGVEAVEASADALISAMGDGRAALAAVLLAGDLGYGVDQIVSAGVEGRLQPDGSILGADGSPLTPDYESSGILDDDVTGDASEALGFRSPPERTRLSSFMNQLNRVQSGEQRGSLMTVLVLFDLGYSLDQIVVAVLADGSVTGRFCLADESGNVIEPHRSPRKLWQREGEAWCKGAPISTVASADTTAPGVTAPDATEPAAEPEGDGSSDEGPLSGTWIMWWINANGNRNDAFRIRFNGVHSGTLEVLNDETEFDTFFTVDGDVVTFGFTRLLALDPEYYTQESVSEISFIIGEFEHGNSMVGLWEREAWECSPAREPPCTSGTDPVAVAAGLTREG